MAQRIPGPSSAPPSNNEAPGPPPDLRGRVDDTRKAVLSILKDTDWPRQASNDVQDLIRKMEAPLALNKLPKEGTEIFEQVKTIIRQLLGHLENAQTRLREESEKYGARKKGFRETFKAVFSRNDPSQCAGIVRSCRNDIVEGWKTLNDLLERLEAGNEQRHSKGPQDTHATQNASTSNPHVNTQSDLTATPVPSNSPPNQSTTQRDQITSSKTGKQKGSSARSGRLNSANMTFKLAEVAAGALPVVGSYVGAVAKLGSTVVEMVQTMDGNDETAERLENHVCRLSDVLERVEKRSQGSENTLTIDGMNELQQELQSVQHQIKELEAQRGMKKVWSSNDNAGSLKNLQEQVRAALEEIQLLANLNVSILVNELNNESVRNEQQRLLDRLGDGKYGARGNLAESVACLPGTRVEVLERIDAWVRSTERSQRVLWVRGMAGRGKSTIASTVAVNWERRAACAIFHFRRGQNKLDNRLVCSLARQLGKSVDPELRSAILSSVRENQDIADQRLDEQFNALFVTPLSAVRTTLFPILIIIDALDECDSDDYALDFVKLIEMKLPMLPDNVKFLLTSRPEAQLLRALEPMEWRTESLDSGVEVDSDIERFLQHRLSETRKAHRIKDNWPSPAVVSKLVEMSQGLFQWARTAMKYISEGSPTARLTEILGAPEMWSGVDELYTQILSKALENVNPSPSKRDLFLSVLGTLLAAPYPVSLEVVAFLHSDDGSIVGHGAEEVLSFFRDEILADLNSLFYIPDSPKEPIRLMHTSIRDLLVDRNRCGKQPYWIDLKDNHQRLAAVCTRKMNDLLRKNIFGLTDISKPSSKAQAIIAQGVPWSQLVAPRLTKTDFMLFSEEKVLYWLEVMSMVGELNEATMMAKRVHEWLLRHVDERSLSNSLIILWNDVQRFITAFEEPIAFSPLHIYVSALSHCPVKTELWKRYSNHAEIRTIRGVQPPTWPSDLWTRAVKGPVTSVAFSPDGAVLALGCGDRTIHLLDPHTGREIREPLTGHRDTVRSVCFSPDGRLLASGSSDNTIRLWDPHSGGQVGEPLTGHRDSVQSVCFSPDTKLLASGSSDKTIRLWDPQTGSQVGEPLTGHIITVWSICFSPGGKLLASGSSDKTIRLWNPQTGSQIGEPLTGHTGAVSSVCFSQDGKLLASGSWNNNIRLWDPQTGSQEGEPLTGHTGPVFSVCFSPGGRLLASGSFDHTIRLWDPQIGSQVGEPLTGHSHHVGSVCFSPDGKLLASGSSDNTVRLWDPQIGSQMSEPVTGHSSTVWSVCFSPDGKLLASGSYDDTIRLWNPQTGSQVGEPLTGHSGTVHSVCFSPDGKLLASGSFDNTIQLWDPQTGSQEGEPLTGHTNTVHSVCFSPDGKLLASGSLDKTVRLWDPQNGSQVGEPLTGHDRGIRSVWFSPDGKVIAARGFFGQPMAWDTFTRQRCDVPPSISPATALAYNDHWVTFSSSRLFWLPPHYWGRYDWILTLCEGKLAVAHANAVSIFDISDALSMYNIRKIHSPYSNKTK